MENITINITKEQYKKYAKASYDEQRKFLASNFVDLYYGYGIYGHTFHEINGKYTIDLTIGSSCD